MPNAVKKEGQVISSDHSLVIEAFNTLMGMNGDRFAQEIIDTGILSQMSYDLISANIAFNGKSSVCKYFGVVHWYYLRGLKVSSITDKF